MLNNLPLPSNLTESVLLAIAEKMQRHLDSGLGPESQDWLVIESELYDLYGFSSDERALFEPSRSPAN